MASRKKLGEGILKIAFLGKRREADDIIEYIEMLSALLGSLLVGIGMALWIGKLTGAWIGLIAGFGLYAAGITLCSLVFFHGHKNRQGHRHEL